jgi:hypothetical protein
MDFDSRTYCSLDVYMTVKLRNFFARGWQGRHGCDQIRAMPLLEREPLLEALDAYLIEGAGGRGRVVSWAGRPGSVRRSSSFGERVAGTVRVLRGACDGAITPRPLGPLVDVAMTSAPPMT